MAPNTAAEAAEEWGEAGTAAQGAAMRAVMGETPKRAENVGKLGEAAAEAARSQEGASKVADMAAGAAEVTAEVAEMTVEAEGKAEIAAGVG